MLDDDLLPVARRLAEQRGMKIGQIISELARTALAPKGTYRTRNGVPLFTPKGSAKKPGLALINRLRDAE